MIQTIIYQYFMQNKIKIIILGIGGVGGYFGGLLAQKYAGSEAVEVYFVARGEHLKQIQAQGLTLVENGEKTIAIPFFATDNPAEIGVSDYIFICTKSYDLAQSAALLKPCINENTILIPLLNGVSSVEILENQLPNAIILEACVYIVAQIQTPGVIINGGYIQKIFFGKKNFQPEKLIELEKLLRAANIEATFAENIETLVWEKFIFISPIASATSYFDCFIGELLDNEERKNVLACLLTEVIQVTLAKGISIDSEIFAKTWQKMESLPAKNTSSMHNDYKNGKKNTEMESLTAYVLKIGKELGVETPTFARIYEALLHKY